MKKDWVFDCGNTNIKWAAFDAETLKRHEVGRRWLPTIAEALAEQQPDRVLVAASGRVPQDLVALMDQTPNTTWHFLRPGDETGTPLDYNTPETLGLDRVANAAAVRAAGLDGAVLVIDAGTCVTADLVANGVFRGGSIAPGLHMRLRALHAFTAGLPDLTGSPFTSNSTSVPAPDLLLGKSTNESMWAGALGGLHHELNGRIAAFLKDWPELQVCLTGGDASHLQLPSQCRIFADPLWTIKGFRHILNHIADH